MAWSHFVLSGWLNQEVYRQHLGILDAGFQAATTQNEGFQKCFSILVDFGATDFDPGFQTQFQLLSNCLNDFCFCELCLNDACFDQGPCKRPDGSKCLNIDDSQSSAFDLIVDFEPPSLFFRICVYQDG